MKKIKQYPLSLERLSAGAKNQRKNDKRDGSWIDKTPVRFVDKPRIRSSYWEQLEYQKFEVELKYFQMNQTHGDLNTTIYM